MNRRFAQLIAVITLATTFTGGGYQAMAQDVSKDAKEEAKRQKAMERNERWAQRQEAKMIKRLVKEGKINTPATARGSEVGFIDANGRFITVGYFDKINSFRSYARHPER